MSSEWIYSVTMIVPAAVQQDANRLAEGLGHGPNNFSVPLSADGSAPATHYGSRAQAQQSFIDLLTAAGGGQLPEVEGMTPEEIGGVLVSLIADVSTAEDGYSHFSRVLEEQGLQRVAMVEAQAE